MSLVIIGCVVRKIIGRNNVISNRRDDTSAYIGGNSKELRKATILKYVLQMVCNETVIFSLHSWLVYYNNGIFIHTLTFLHRNL